MQRGQLEGGLEVAEHLVVDQGRPGEPLAAVNHPVAHGADVADRGEPGTRVRRGEPAEYVVHGEGMAPERGRASEGVGFAGAERQHRLPADPLDLTPGQPLVGVRLDALRVGAHQLELEGR